MHEKIDAMNDLVNIAKKMQSLYQAEIDVEKLQSANKVMEEALKDIADDNIKHQKSADQFYNFLYKFRAIKETAKEALKKVMDLMV